MCVHCIPLFSAAPCSYTIAISDFPGLVNKLLNKKWTIASQNFDGQGRISVQNIRPYNIALIEHGAISGRLVQLFNSAPRG